MIRVAKVFLFALPIVAGVVPASASDSNPLGLYLGGGAGHTNVRARIDSLVELDESATGWKAMIGVRPIRMLGAELEYVDFGHPRSTANSAFIIQSNALQRATGLSGLAYLPIPLPLLDIYGRIGVARLQSSGGADRYSCNVGFVCPTIYTPPSRFNRTDVDLLYGAGLQVKLPIVAVRLEYERINDHDGDPDMVSLGLTWSF